MKTVSPLPFWSFKRDKNLRSFLRMVGLHFDGEGNVWVARERCPTHGLNCNKRACYILLQIFGKRTDNNYNIRVYKHTDDRLIGTVFLARFWEIASLFAEKKSKPDKFGLRVGQIWHIVDSIVGVDDLYRLDYSDNSGLRFAKLHSEYKKNETPYHLIYDVNEFQNRGNRVWKRLLIDV